MDCRDVFRKVFKSEPGLVINSESSTYVGRVDFDVVYEVECLGKSDSVNLDFSNPELVVRRVGGMSFAGVGFNDNKAQVRVLVRVSDSGGRNEMLREASERLRKAGLTQYSELIDALLIERESEF